jgi:hypothetical protein
MPRSPILLCVNFQVKSYDFFFHMKACGLMDKLLQHE